MDFENKTFKCIFFINSNSVQLVFLADDVAILATICGYGTNETTLLYQTDSAVIIIKGFFPKGIGESKYLFSG